ncbi:AP-1 complex subunit beta-1-like [Sycon ciliatum]|uniref:AP-1 complex subunit beta-1-like n=1 Tax=Sycon ciliatum TaxID=27933 RepID=UPI0031F71EF2
MTDSKYFSTTKKGEIAELKAELHGDKRDKKREAVKKIIAMMTVGKDVSSLFPDVINCMQTPDLELKKLVYLYLMNYAKTQPDMAIMAVNTFVRDCDDPNPLLRALAVRTMGCIRVDKITEYLCDPLRKCLKDTDPYVRKTAAVCVAKMYDINADLVEDQGFLELLKELLSDSNPMVVANAAASLAEISDSSGRGLESFAMNATLVNKLLAALNECTEWGQTFILDSLSLYQPGDDREAKSIIERVAPRLAHANAAVVLSAVKVIIRLMAMLDETSEFYDTMLKKLSPPLVTLLAGNPEIQYVALRNISLILQKHPEVLRGDIKVFFVKYNDPIYVKLEKLAVIVRLCNDTNTRAILTELKEYASEVDIDFVRKAVRAIGLCAIKVSSETERAVQTLLELIETKVNYVVQEAVVVIKDIFRKFPNKYEGIIATLCENLDVLDEPEARGAMVWILGEYADRIDNAGELLTSFVDSFSDETVQVQLQILTAVVKLFLKQPSSGQDLVQTVLSLATQDSDNPDLRDRGYIYWRLLSTDPAAAKEVVLTDRPRINEETDLLDSGLLDELISNIATLASVYHKPPSTFGSTSMPVQRLSEQRATQSSTRDEDESPADIPVAQPVAEQPAAPAPALAQVDLLSGGVPNGAPALQYEGWLAEQQGKGLRVEGTFSRRAEQLFMELKFTNCLMQPISGFAIQFNKNSFGIAPAAALSVPMVMPNCTETASLALTTAGQVQRMDPLNMLQVAVKTNVDVVYFAANVPFHLLWMPDGEMERKSFLTTWKEIPSTNEVSSVISSAMSVETAEEKLKRWNFFIIAKRNVELQTMIYASAKYVNGIFILAEFKFSPSAGNVAVALKTRGVDIVPGTQQALTQILQGQV